jgi:cytoskeletal protein CcmA (bactofilin family)
MVETIVAAQPDAAPASVERRTLIVGRGITLQGTVSDAERLVVEGTVDSKMIHAVELQVAQLGMFNGEIEVESAEIAGSFDGSMTVRGRLVLRSSGTVTGIVRCRWLSVDEGGRLSGAIEMLTDAARPAGTQMRDLTPVR